jgi:hypothetical protein
MQTGNLMVDAEAAFARERRRRRREQAARWLLRRRRGCRRLLSLEQALGAAPPAYRRELGMRTISVDSIVGTAESAKAGAFDCRLRPPLRSRRRWEGLWIAARRAAPLPPISVIQLGEQHFVLDGHHRVSVARALGMTAIDAEVTQLAAGIPTARER